MPCSGPRYLPAAISCVGLLRLLQRQVARQRDDAMQLGIELLQPLQIDLGEALGGQLAGLDPARELGDGGEGDVFVASGQRAGVDRCCGRTGRAAALRFARAKSGPNAWRERGSFPARVCAGRCGARRGSHGLAPACRRRLRARRRSSQTALAFRLRRRSWRDTSGPTAGPAPNAGGAPGGRSAGFCGAGFWAWPRSAAAAPRAPNDVSVMNCLRDFAMNPPRGILAAIARPVAIRGGYSKALTTKDTKVHEGKRTVAKAAGVGIADAHCRGGVRVLGIRRGLEAANRFRQEFGILVSENPNACRKLACSKDDMT